jgi:hypothetical protein
MTEIVRASLGLPTLRAGPQFQNPKPVWVIENWNLRLVCNLVLEICPADSHPSGGFPVWDFGIKISNQAKSRDSFLWERLSSRELEALCVMLSKEKWEIIGL